MAISNFADMRTNPESNKQRREDEEISIGSRKERGVGRCISGASSLLLLLFPFE
jgi:hypothetical protein